MSLRWRVAMAFGVASLLLAAVFALTTWNLASDYLVRQRETGALRQAQVNVRLVDSALGAGPDRVNDLLTGLSTDPYSTVLLARPENWLSSGRPVDPAALPGGLLAMARDGTPTSQRLVVDGVPVLVVALPTRAPDTTFVELFPLVQLDSALRFLSAVLAAGTAASALLGLGLGFWMSGRALRPIGELTAAAARMAGGDLSARAPGHGDPDLAPLAASFNATAEALEQRVRRDARFAGDVSHELRSPLTTMANAVEVLRRRRSEMADTARRAVDLLASEVHRFQRTVTDLLEISREDQQVDQRAFETVDVAALVRHVVAARPDPKPVVATDGQQLHVLADRRRLDRVVANLLNNAEHHGGGPVRVSVSRRGECVRLEVDDTGPGVPPEQRERIFDRFARGDRAGRRGDGTGSGLGLALVDQHVRRHGGEVWVDDRPGGGARFVVELPAEVHSGNGHRTRRPDGAPRGHPAEDATIEDLDRQG